MPIHIGDRSRPINFIKSFKGLAQHSCLLIYIAGLTQGVPKRPAQKDRSRRFYFFGVFPNNGDADGGYTDCFDDPLNQSDGLIANASGRREQNGIHPVLFEHSSHPWPCFGYERVDVGSEDMAHKAVMEL